MIAFAAAAAEFGQRCRSASPVVMSDLLAPFAWLAETEIEPAEGGQHLQVEIGEEIDDPSSTRVDLKRMLFWAPGGDVEELGVSARVSAAPPTKHVLLYGSPRGFEPESDLYLELEPFLLAVRAALADSGLHGARVREFDFL